MTPEESLFALSAAYARAADRRDAAAFCAVFEPAGALHLCDPADPAVVTRTLRGHEELAKVPGRLARYARTFHLLGQATYDVHGEHAAGEVYCVAHHLTLDQATAEDRVLFIRYTDRYRSTPKGGWRISERTLRIDWTETRAADHPDGHSR